MIDPGLRKAAVHALARVAVMCDAITRLVEKVATKLDEEDRREKGRRR